MALSARQSKHPYRISANPALRYDCCDGVGKHASKAGSAQTDAPHGPCPATPGRRHFQGRFRERDGATAEFFSATDPNTPFYDSQLGAREAK